ncbi:MAG: sigma-70 family RNA polymerase sigma factor [Opitutae bacterium]|nr:sigma-70 family RNA polymerase sigma factor [Opitutae bacterium]
MPSDHELLCVFAATGGEQAFAELVRRQINLVYSTALRQVGGDAHLAADVTQGVFLALARSAQTLTDRSVLSGWLYTTTRFLAAKAVRTEQRWRVRTQEAHAMNEILHDSGPEPVWADISPLLDEAMHALGERDREAILLRFFENRPFAEIGAVCGLAENAARMRVERALEKLRVQLAKRGITSTAAALGGVLAGQPAIAAPAGLVATATGVALASVSTGGSIAAFGGILKFMSTSKLALGVVGAVLVVAAGVYVVGRDQSNSSSVGIVIASPDPGSKVAKPSAESLRPQNERSSLTKSAPVPRSPTSAAPVEDGCEEVGAINLTDMPPHVVLGVYEMICGKKLSVAANVSTVYTPVSVKTGRQKKAKALAILEEALIQQAGIEIVHGQDGRQIAQRITRKK